MLNTCCIQCCNGIGYIPFQQICFCKIHIHFTQTSYHIMEINLVRNINSRINQYGILTPVITSRCRIPATIFLRTYTLRCTTSHICLYIFFLPFRLVTNNCSIHSFITVRIHQITDIACTSIFNFQIIRKQRIIFTACYKVYGCRYMSFFTVKSSKSFY